MMTREEGQHEICPCCGCHVGLDDIDLESVKEQREEWLSTGPTWWRKNESAPHHWNPIEQMKNIPPEWR